MRVITHYDPMRMRVDVFVEMFPGSWLDSEGKVVTVPPETTPPTFVGMPERVAELLKLELDGRPEPATNRHLDDAIAVRDRLLTMIETKP